LHGEISKKVLSNTPSFDFIDRKHLVLHEGNKVILDLSRIMETEKHRVAICTNTAIRGTLFAVGLDNLQQVT